MAAKREQEPRQEKAKHFLSIFLGKKKNEKSMNFQRTYVCVRVFEVSASPGVLMSWCPGVCIVVFVLRLLGAKMGEKKSVKARPSALVTHLGWQEPGLEMLQK